MTFFEALVALLTTTTAAGAAGVLVASGAVATADATDRLPDPPDEMVVEVVEAPADNETLQATEAAAETEELSEEIEPQDADDQGVAGAVHEALTGDSDLAPGDPDFGATVAQRAREGGAAFGAGVANAASDGKANPGGDDVDDDDPDLEGEATDDESSVEEEEGASEGSATGHDRRSTFSPRH